MGAVQSEVFGGVGAAQHHVQCLGGAQGGSQDTRSTALLEAPHPHPATVGPIQEGLLGLESLLPRQRDVFLICYVRFYEYLAHTAQQKVDKPFKKKQNLVMANSLLKHCLASKVKIDATKLQDDLDRMNELHTQFNEWEGVSDLVDASARFMELQSRL